MKLRAGPPPTTEAPPTPRPPRDRAEQPQFTRIGAAISCLRDALTVITSAGRERITLVLALAAAVAIGSAASAYLMLRRK